MSAAPQLAPLSEIDALARDVSDIWWDLPRLAGLLEITTKDEGKIPFVYDSWHPEQKRFERERTGRDFVLKARQIGFSTIELARDYQYARTHEGSSVVVMVHTDRVKEKFFSAVKLFNRVLSEKWGLVPAAVKNTETVLRWDDIDSSISVITAGNSIATAKDRGRSGTINRLHATEVAFYKQPDETMSALFAALGDNECVIESTANGVGNWFHTHAELVRHGRFSNFAWHFYPWFEHQAYRADPRTQRNAPTTKRAEFWEDQLRTRFGCDDEQIAWWRAQVSLHKIDKALREYPPTPEAAFQESGDTWIEAEYLDRLASRVNNRPTLRAFQRGAGTERTKFPPLRVHRAPEAGRPYLLIVDPSGGTGRDEAAMKVLDHRSGEDCASWDDNKTKPGELGHLAAEVGRFYNNALIVCERNNWNDGGAREGAETLKVLSEVLRYPRLYADEKGVLGFVMHHNIRSVVMGDLVRMIEDDESPIWSPDAKTVSEAKTMVTDDNDRPAARNKGKPGGADDGLIMCWATGHYVRSAAPMPGAQRPSTVGSPLSSAGFRT